MILGGEVRSHADAEATITQVLHDLKHRVDPAQDCGYLLDCAPTQTILHALQDPHGSRAAVISLILLPRGAG